MDALYIAGGLAAFIVGWGIIVSLCVLRKKLSDESEQHIGLSATSHPGSSFLVPREARATRSRLA